MPSLEVTGSFGLGKAKESLKPEVSQVVFAFFPVLVRSSSGIAHLADYLFGIRQEAPKSLLPGLAAIWLDETLTIWLAGFRQEMRE